MGKKFIPTGDPEFAQMADSFARTIAANLLLYEVSQAESEALSAAVTMYRAALQKARHGSDRSRAATAAKDDARKAAERIIRPMGHVIRSNPRLDAASKILVGITPRKEKAKILPCPQEPPRLRFVRALHEGNGATPMHELEFQAYDLLHSKPAGAVRLELFVDLTPPDEPIPAHPGANHASRPWYLRSYTRSPIKLTPPIARMPMRVVYWGRWADSLGGVGPFSATAVAWIEGGSGQYLPGGTGISLSPLDRKQIPILEDLNANGPEGREDRYHVAVLEMRYGSMSGSEMPNALPAPAQRPTRQLEGPPVEEAA